MWKIIVLMWLMLHDTHEVALVSCFVCHQDRTKDHTNCLFQIFTRASQSIPKIGAPVVIIPNVLNPHRINGKIFIVKTIISRVTKYRHSWQLSSVPRKPSLPFKVRRLQFPLLLAFIAVVHKSQAQPFSRAVVDPRKGIFVAGKL